MTYQNSWDAVKVEIRGKFISLQAYLQKWEIPNNQINITLKDLEKEEQK